MNRSEAVARLERGFVSANRIAIFAMMAVMTALVFANVVARYILGISIIWAEEVSQYLMVWVTYLGAGLAMREGRHVAVEMLQDFLPARLAYAMRLCVGVGILVFLVVLTWLGFEFAAFAWPNETPVLNIPQGIPYLAIPIGAIVFGLHFVLMFRDYLVRRYEAPESLDAETAPAGIE